MYESAVSDPHVWLDGIGLIPLVGEWADAVNAGLYLVEGDYANSGLSAVAALPFVGPLGPVRRAANELGGELIQSVQVIEGGQAIHTIRRADGTIVNVVQIADGQILGGPSTLVRGDVSPANRASHEQYLDELRDLEQNGSRGPIGAVEAADAATASGQTSGAAAQFDIDGQSFVDVSGSDTPIHPDVQRALDEVPEERLSPWHGGCAEPRCLSQAIEAGLDPSGGVMNAVQIGDGGRVPHGNLRPPCSSCAAVRDAIGYTQE